MFKSKRENNDNDYDNNDGNTDNDDGDKDDRIVEAYPLYLICVIAWEWLLTLRMTIYIDSQSCLEMVHDSQ